MITKVIIGIVVLAVILGGFYFYNSNYKSAPVAPQMTAQPTPVASATPTPPPAFQAITNQGTINLTPAAFSPATLTVKAGTKVTWVNQSNSDAIIASNPHPVHTDYPPLNLGKFSPGGTLSLTFDKPGTYGYHNHLDPTETGTIIVQ